MHLEPLRALLVQYAAANPGEESVANRFLALVEAHPDCLARTCLPGHITASAFIVSADQRAFLMTHHRKLGKWLQLGGHVDGDPNVLRAALREAREESGMAKFEAIGPPGTEGSVGASAMPLDLDIHGIPARPGEPAHDHYDVRFLLRAAPGQDLVMSDESTDLAWFPMAGADEIEGRESIGRLWRKARRWLATD